MPDATTPPTNRRKPGAPRGNRNRMTHGAYSFLALGRLPKGASYVSRQLGELRRALETAVQQAHGEITLHRAATIQSVCRHEGRAVLLGRWLRDADGLPLADRLALLHEMAAAAESRDKSLRALKIDQAGRQPDPWAALTQPAALAAPRASFDPALAPPGLEVNGGPTA